MTDHGTARIGDVEIGSGKLALIAGPCVAESKQLCLDVAGKLAEICAQLGIGYIFKASYDKANRSSIDSYRGPGMEDGLAWLAEVKAQIGVPVTSDVHLPAQAAPAAQVLDCLQIPAFLCRQTDLLVAAAGTQKTVNVKKAQFMAPLDMGPVVEKLRSSGSGDILLTERGTSFGYNCLVTDFCSVPQMQQFAPVVFDATHSLQQPGSLGNATGARREFAPMLAGAAMAAGADALFIETHPDPDKAKSDAASQIALDDMEPILQRCLAIHEAAGR